MARDKNRFRGCMIGGAIGDALGYAVEFMTLEQIRAKYGVRGITRYELREDKAQISDDTQMTLFTANGLLIGPTRGALRGIAGSHEDYVAACYRDWLRTQDASLHFRNDIRDDHDFSWLIKVPQLHNRRAPGNTCITALRDGVAVENSKGCGGVMRVAPVGLYFDANNSLGMDKEESRLYAARKAAAIARITHGHDLGYIPAASLAYIINSILYYEYSGQDDLMQIVIDCISAISKEYSGSPYLGAFTDIMTKAMELSISDRDDSQCIKVLGEGWVAEETLAIAVFCALRHKNHFENAIIAAVNHDGDSDSTGSVTGNILGAYHGYDALPERFLTNLELKDVIIELADDLWHDCQIKSEFGDSSEDEIAWTKRYFSNQWAAKEE